jgi:predicted AlkP superfamily pyrophosphatase or phosphodiesterase
MVKFALRFLWAIALPIFAFGQDVKQNDPLHLDKPYVILISLDGYRYDYVERFRPPHLSRLIAEGAQAESLLSVFPSKTFPNHYSIATGMYPNQHRLVGNSFYDAEKGAVYGTSKRDLVEDGSWYGGTPLWVNAEQNGMVSASYFFVGTEADIQGVRPTYYYLYDGAVPNSARVGQVLEWLQLPPENRPHFIACYFSDLDDTGHRVGPNNDEVLRKAVMNLDEDLGRLFDGVRSLDLPVHIILVSDHGMAEVKLEDLIPIELLESEEEYLLVSQGALLHLYLKEGADIDSVCVRLRGLEQAAYFTVYKAADFPHYKGEVLDPRVGDVLVLPNFPHYFTRARTLAFFNREGRKVMGEHGFLPEIRDMHGIFYAWGPAFPAGRKVGSFENIHIYPLICKLLGLPVPEEVEGKLEVAKGVME